MTKSLDILRSKLIKMKSFIQLKLIIGIFGIVYGIVAFFYFFLKVSKSFAFIFLIALLVGFFLIYKTKKDILNEKIKDGVIN